MLTKLPKGPAGVPAALRRLLSMRDWPIATPSNIDRAWRGYSPYNPVIVQKLLDIFRIHYNFVKTEQLCRNAGADHCRRDASHEARCSD